MSNWETRILGEILQYVIPLKLCLNATIRKKISQNRIGNWININDKLECLCV